MTMARERAAGITVSFSGTIGDLVGDVPLPKIVRDAQKFQANDDANPEILFDDEACEDITLKIAWADVDTFETLYALIGTTGTLTFTFATSGETLAFHAGLKSITPVDGAENLAAVGSVEFAVAYYMGEVT